MTPRVHVVLPVHNRRDVTARCIDCLVAQTRDDLHLLLVDDGCTDGTVEMVTARLPGTTVLRGRGDWWWGGSLHQAFLWIRSQPLADDELVLILNDDTQFDADFVARGAAALAGRERCLLLAQLDALDGGRPLEAGVHADWRRLAFAPARCIEEINCFSTRGLFLRVGDMRALGGFHPRLLPHYGSDYEYTTRAFRRGYRLLSVPEVRLRVDERTTGIRAPAPGLRAYLKGAFSKRAVHNPAYWSAFVLLACPLRHVPINLARVWWRFLKQAVRAAL
jgi:GT2 family glycosyltransferase